MPILHRTNKMQEKKTAGQYPCFYWDISFLVRLFMRVDCEQLLCKLDQSTRYSSLLYTVKEQLIKQ
jgi:hypothetical protein